MLFLKRIFGPRPRRTPYRFLQIMSALSDLKASVDANTAAVSDAVAKLQAPGVDPIAVATLAGQILTNNKALTDAIALASASTE